MNDTLFISSYTHFRSLSFSIHFSAMGAYSPKLVNSALDKTCRAHRAFLRRRGGHGSCCGKQRRMRMTMKRRVAAIREGCCRRSSSPTNGISRRIETLKKLVPNGEYSSLDGLFRDAAEYIMSLETRVRVLQTMVNLLSSPSDH